MSDSKENISFPKISLITPSFQQGKYLEATIRSVLEQKYINLEYIIIDGNSKDHSVNILRHYSDSLAYWVSEPDYGQADALQKGFQLATGEILGWLNSDDTLEPGSLHAVGAFFLDNPTVGFVYGDYNKIDKDGGIVERKRQPSFDLNIAKYTYLTIAQPGSFWRADIYHKAGGIDSSFSLCMDYDLFLRIASITQVKHLRRTLGNFRVHRDSKTTTLKKSFDFENKLIQTRYCSIKPDSMIFPLVQLFYYSKLIWTCLIEGCLYEKLYYKIKKVL